VFTNCAANRVKVLYWGGRGLNLWCQRLEVGQYPFPPVTDGSLQLLPPSDDQTERANRVTECWAWDRLATELTGHRSASPWDSDPRRPSHADKRRAWRRELLAEQIHAALRLGLTETEIQDAAERLLNLAA